MTAGRKRISLSQDWDPLLVVQCKVALKPYTHHWQKQTQQVVFICSLHTYAYAHIYLCNNNNQWKSGYWFGRGTGEIGRKIIRRAWEKKKEVRKWCNSISTKVRLKIKYIQDYFEDCRKSFYFACLFFFRCLNSRDFITGYYRYCRVLRAIKVLKTLFCRQWFDMGKSWGRRSWYPPSILWEGQLIVRI